MITQHELKKLFHYDPETGIFTHLKNYRGQTRAGDIAGCPSHGYTVIKIAGHPYGAHVLAWLYVTGEFPTIQVDHRNNLRCDNAFLNLRLATQSQQSCNCIVRKTSKSGHKGVSFDNRAKKWLGIVNFQGKRHQVGLFNDLADAVFAVTAKRESLHGEFSRHL